MGTDKAELVVRPGTRQIDHALELLAPLCARLSVSVARQSKESRNLPEGVHQILDVEGVFGPMAGLVASLEFAEGWPVLVIACDMPYLEISHLVQLVNRRNPEKLATAFLARDGKPDPMCAIYEPAALVELKSLAFSGKESLRRFLLDADVETITPPEKRFLTSVNDREQLKLARETLQSESP